MKKNENVCTENDMKYNGKPEAAVASDHILISDTFRGNANNDTDECSPEIIGDPNNESINIDKEELEKIIEEQVLQKFSQREKKLIELEDYYTYRVFELNAKEYLISRRLPAEFIDILKPESIEELTEAVKTLEGLINERVQTLADERLKLYPAPEASVSRTNEKSLRRAMGLNMF